MAQKFAPRVALFGLVAAALMSAPLLVSPAEAKFNNTCNGGPHCRIGSCFNGNEVVRIDRHGPHWRPNARLCGSRPVLHAHPPKSVERHMPMHAQPGAKAGPAR